MRKETEHLSAVTNQATITREHLHHAALQQPPGGASAADRAQHKWEQAQQLLCGERANTGHTQARIVHLRNEILINTLYVGLKGVVLREIS